MNSFHGQFTSSQVRHYTFWGENSVTPKTMGLSHCDILIHHILIREKCSEKTGGQHLVGWVGRPLGQLEEQTKVSKTKGVPACILAPPFFNFHFLAFLPRPAKTFIFSHFITFTGPDFQQFAFQTLWSISIKDDLSQSPMWIMSTMSIFSILSGDSLTNDWHQSSR